MEVGRQEEMLTALQGWARERKLDIAAMMTVKTAGDGRFGRELLIWGMNARAAGAVRGFAEANADGFGLEPWNGGQLDEETGAAELRLCWEQRALDMSRKQVAPKLREAMRNAPKL